MKITSKMALPVTVNDKDGKKKTIVIRPGVHEYKEINHKDPMVAEQLRVLRKHTEKNGIQFAELLPCDVVALKGMTGTPEEKAEKLKASQGLRGSVVLPAKQHPGRGAKNTESAGRKAHMEAVKHGRTVGNVGQPEAAVEDNGSGKGGRGVSQKKQD